MTGQQHESSSQKSRENRDESIIAGLMANATRRRLMPED
jgi:hypothetical protein